MLFIVRYLRSRFAAASTIGIQSDVISLRNKTKSNQGHDSVIFHYGEESEGRGGDESAAQISNPSAQ